MNVTIIVSLITLGGVALSVVVNHFTSRITLKNEILKITSAVEQSFTQSILEERRVRYPTVYALLSNLAKDIQAMQDGVVSLRTPIDKEHLATFKAELDELDVQHAVFFSTETANSFSNLRDETYDCMCMLKDNSELLSDKSLDKLRTAIALAEMALKIDLGIPIDEFQEVRAKYKSFDFKNYKKRASV